MKELLTYVVQSLVDHPDEVSVTERKADGETIFEVRVADGDMGKVIGRQGRIVKQIRVLMRAVAQRKGKKVSVEIMDCAPVRRCKNTYTFFTVSVFYFFRFVRSISDPARFQACAGSGEISAGCAFWPDSSSWRK